TRAGRPDSPGRMFGPPPARLPQLLRSLKSPKPECALEPPAGLAAALRLQLGVGVVIGVNVASGVPAGSRRLALLIARKTAVAAPGAEIAALDAERIVLRGGGKRAGRQGGGAYQQQLQCPSHGVL